MAEWTWLQLGAQTAQLVEEEDPRETVRRLRAEVMRLAETRGRGAAPTLAAEVELGSALRFAGSLGEARTQLQGVASQAAALLGEDHAVTVRALRELGLTQLAAGEFSAAGESLERAQRLSEKRRGPDSAEHAMNTGNLALLHFARGDLDGALSFQRETIGDLRETLGECSRPFILAETNLAAVLGASGQQRAATELVEEVLRDRLDESDELKISLFQLHGSWAKQERRSQAWTTLLRLLRQASADVDLHGDLDPRNLHLHPVGLESQPEERERLLALDLATDVHARRIGHLGPAHPQTLYATRLLASALASSDPGRALAVGSEAAESSAEVLGRAHLDTVAAFDELAGLLEINDRERMAVTIREENRQLLASNDEIVGDDPPPIENLAGTLTDPPQLRGLVETWTKNFDAYSSDAIRIEGRSAAEPAAGAPTAAPTGDDAAASAPAPEELVRRTAHLELEPGREIEPGERFRVTVFVDCDQSAGPGTGELTLRPPPGVERLTLSAWLVVSRHFEILGARVQPLELDLREDSSPRLSFDVAAVASAERFEEDPTVRVLFSYEEWPCGQVSLAVPLLERANGATA